jgi:hypothetical protein
MRGPGKSTMGANLLMTTWKKLAIRNFAGKVNGCIGEW